MDSRGLIWLGHDLLFKFLIADTEVNPVHVSGFGCSWAHCRTRDTMLLCRLVECLNAFRSTTAPLISQKSNNFCRDWCFHPLLISTRLFVFQDAPCAILLIFLLFNYIWAYCCETSCVLLHVGLKGVRVAWSLSHKFEVICWSTCIYNPRVWVGDQIK